MNFGLRKRQHAVAVVPVKLAVKEWKTRISQEELGRELKAKPKGNVLAAVQGRGRNSDLRDAFCWSVVADYCSAAWIIGKGLCSYTNVIVAVKLYAALLV